jgi:hypothetical protein
MSEHDDKQREDAERKQREDAQRKQDEQKAKSAPADEFDEPTTKDGTDVGVEMEAGSPGEPVGPEDAFGEGLKRGDYADRVGTNQHATSVPTEDGGEPIYNADGDVVDVKPRSEMVSQNDRVDEVGDEAGEKGGVTTTAV